MRGQPQHQRANIKRFISTPTHRRDLADARRIFGTTLHLISSWGTTVEVALEDCYKTAFVTHHGLFIYNVILFGLFNTSATF